MDALKASVFTHEAYGLWVSPDLKALRLQASFIESRLDYNAIYNGFMKIRKAEEDHNHNILSRRVSLCCMAGSTTIFRIAPRSLSSVALFC